MLKNRKNVRKIANILIILITIIVTLGVCSLTVESIDIGNGAITPIYKPKWTKVSSSISGETISVVLKGTATESQDIDDNTKINYSSNVTTALSTDDILVYINGELDGDTNGNGVLDTGETPSITKTLTLPDPTTAAEITQTLTLSGFTESARQPDKPYKEWSGNISIKILGRGESTDTYDADVLIDVYGNQNMMELDDATGTWNDIIFKDDDSTTNINTSGTMFTDFVKPEFTYKYTNTVIDHNTKKVTIVFDVVDKYFSAVTSTFIKDNLTVKISDYEDDVVQAKISKELNLKTIDTETTDATTGATYKTNGDIYYDVNNDGTQEKIGQRYELIISELEQNPNDGFDFSGYMNIAFPADIVEDLSGNKNNAKTITVGIDEPTNSMTFPYLPTNYSYVEGDVDTGLVIQDPLGNQYVWVEVPRNTTVYSAETLELDLDNLSGSALEDAYDAIESDLHIYTSTYRNGTENTDIWYSEEQTGLTETAYYELKNKMLKSVFENGGFYVGRYETGIADSQPDVIDTTVEARTDKTQAIEDYTPVIQANAYPYNYVTCIQAQTLASSMASGGYTSSLMFGVQWDLVLKYMETKATNQDTIVSELISDSGSWGNYINYPRDITNTSAKYSTDEGITWSDDAVGQSSRGKLLSTGAISDYSKQKIYDLAGNVGEWTLEHIPGTTGSPSVTRSGSCWSYGNGSPANSRGAQAQILSNGVTGFRVALFENEGTESELIGNQGVVVDVVDPIWMVENKTVTSTTVDGQPVTSASMDFIVVDKYFEESTLELDDIQILVEGVDINQVDAEGNLIIAPELQRSLSDPIYIKWDNETGTYEENVTQAEANGQKYTFTLSNLEESDDLFFEEREKYNTDPATGRVYREYSGPATVLIPKGIATDQYGNDSEEFSVSLGNIDTLKPEVIKVSSTYNINTDNVELSTHTIVFDIVDKYFDTSAITTTDTSKIHVYLDNELTEIDTDGDGVVDTDTVTKTITNIEQLNALVGGSSEKVGYRYTLVLSDFQNPRTSINYDREYTDWSGALTVKIDANTAYDKNGLANDETILAGNEINTSTIANADFVDYIKPDATYQFSSSDIDYTNKKFTMTFDITDKFYNEDLSLTDLQILSSAENETGEGEDGYYDLMSNDKIGKSLISEDITNTVNGTPKVIGKRYTLVLSNLEQLQRIEGNYYLDYSGSITIIIPEGSVKDNGPKGDGTSKNGNDVTSIVSGINIPGGEISDIEVIDVVHPLWERESFTTDIHNKTATITVLGSDKDFWEDQYEDTVEDTDKYGTLTTDEIKLFVDGVETSGNITLNEGTKLYEERIVKDEYGDGSLTGELTTETVQYGIRYTITITNFPIDANQVKIQLIEGSLVDKSDNLSRATEFLVYNTLIATNTETAATSKFLNEIVPEGGTAIARQDIEKVVFVNSTSASTAEGVQNVWDASAQRDNSILAWYSETTAPYTVYIGSNDNIYGNVNSSYLFSYIGYGESSVNTQVIEGLNLLHTENVTNMSYMFQYFGYQTLATLDLGTNFDTTNVTNMSHMFDSTGFTVMTSLDLGDKFNTSKVTDMSYMFNNCGQTAFQTITFGNQFNTSEVLYMNYMFAGLGQNSTAFTTLDLGTTGITFNTSKVTNMSSMFKECGKNSISTFSLGSNFNTQEVINMNNMFQDFGYALETLTLGEKFNTSNVTSMQQMFAGCGMTNLELGDNFDTSNVSGSGMYRMFFGYGTAEKAGDLNLGNKFNTSKVTDMAWMFGYCDAKTIDLGDNFYTTSATSVAYMFNSCTVDILDLGPAFTKIPENNSGFMFGGPVIYASESIYSDMTHFKLSTDSTTILDSASATIIPIYKPTWEKVSTTVDVDNKTISITIKGNANETFTNGDYTGTYSSEIKSYFPTGDELTTDQAKLINIYIDGELDGDTDGSGTLESTETPTIKRKVVQDSSTSTEVQYTITLSGFEQSTRLTGKNFTEWAGNIAIQPVKGTLVDKYGSYIGTQTVENEDGSTSEVQVPVTNVFEDASGNKIGNQNMVSIDDSEGNWNNIQLEEETTVDRNTAETMFTDYIKPEFTYEYYNTEIEGDTGANTVIDYTNNKVTVVFDVTDKYFNTVTEDFISDNITVMVDNDADANTQIEKALTKTGIFVMNKTTKEVTLKAATYTPTTAEQKVGERYQLVLTNIESEYGVGYSGVVSLSFPAGIITDLSGNASDATSITIGIDKPTNPDHDGDDGEPDHDTGVVVDVVDPIWSYVTSDIDRTNNQVNIYILGSDKFYKENTLTKDNITVYVDNSSTTVDTDRDGEQDANVSNITKVLTPITDETELANMAATIGLTDDITDNLTKASIGYKLTLSTFGTISGQTKVLLPAGTIEDTSGNKNRDTTINVGNITWVEDNEPLEEGDAGYPRYPAFRNHIVDFIKPIITYTYSTTEGEENPDVDYEYKKVTVKFTVTDKYLLESALIDTDNKPKNLSIKVDGETVFSKAENIALVNATISSTDIANGKEYTLVVSNIEQNPNDGFNYSGTMQLVFEAGAIEDTSGNVNNVKTITLDTEIDTDIVDVVDPIIMLTEVDGLKLSHRNGSNTINRTDNVDTVTIKIRATDKYLSTGVLGTEENKARIKVKTVKYDGTVIENSATVASVVKNTQVAGTTPYMEYTITLSNFGSNDEGVVSITIPDGVISDTSGNTNQETTLYVGNATWEEPEGTQYTAFNNSIVDFTDPVWEYATSSITRDRTGQVGTVTVKILGKDNYYHSNSLTKDIIEVYVNETLNDTIQKQLDPITDTAQLNGYNVGYTLTLSDFGTNDGITKIKLPPGTIRDTSGNGNLVKEIFVGNEEWIETDVEVEPVDPDNPKYTAFRDSIVDFIKPVITYQYEVDANGVAVNPVLDRTDNAENVKITFNVTDTNFLESNIGIEDIQIFADVGANEQEITTLLRDRSAIGISSSAITNGMSYTLTLSKFELDSILTGEIFKRHSGVIKLVIAANQVEDTSGNKNNQTTLIIDNDDGDDAANGIIVDFVDPIIYYHDKYINWDKRYAEITLRATDRFYDENTKLDPADITLYELNLNEEWIQITDFENKITITPVENDYGYDFVIKLSDFEEEFKMKVSIPAGKLGDTSGNTNQFTEIEVILDNKKPRWQYVSTDTSEFESTGVISFNVKGVDKFLRLEDSELEVGDIKILQDGQDITNVDNITLSAATDNTTEKSKSYTINVSGLTTAGKTYTLLIAEGTLIDEFTNTSAATTINFSKSAISSNTDNYTNITYHVSYDKEHIHSSYVHELMSVNTTGTNAGTTTFRPSTLGELNNHGKNPLFAEPFKYDEDTQTQTASYFAGWRVADANGFDVQGGTVYGLYDEIPNTVVNLKAVWGDARVIFVSDTEGDNSYDGLSPDTAVADIETAYSKLNASGTAESNIIVIMDAVEWNSNTVLDKNATITSLYAGMDYRASNNAELKISSNMQTNGNIIIDNIELYSSSDSTALIANYNDITLGRRITTSSGYTFGSVIGGNYQTESNTGELGTHTVRVESGKYNNIIAGSTITTPSTDSKLITHNVVIGNMRDTAVSRNDKLTITGYVAAGENELRCYPSGANGAVDAYTMQYLTMTLYSGTFTSGDIAIYGRSLGGQNDGKVTLDMYGGDITGDVYAGPAYTTTTHSSEVVNTMNFYGGEVTGDVYGQGKNADFTGSSTINLAGRIKITGNVHGGSYSNTDGSGDGRGNISINVSTMSATVTENIFGGGNGTSNYAYITGDTSITVEAGTLNNVYGSGNGSGNSGSTNITINNGSISGNVVGGAKDSQVETDTNITVVGGTIGGNIYGGNENSSSMLESDTILQNGNITIGSSDAVITTKPTINGNIYGAGTYDKVGTTTINLIKSENELKVFGGSNADSETTTANIYLKGATTSVIYGGGQSAGTVETSKIYLQSGSATDVYGGGYSANVTTSNVYLGETQIVDEVETIVGTATVGTIYGGSNTSGTVTTSNVILTSGNATNVFGGGNSANTTTANVTLNGITINSIHGGSKDAGTTTTTNVTLTTGTVTNVFGGGLDSEVGTSNVIHQGTATVGTIYGGNNSGTGSGGTVGTSNVNIINSEVQNIYGGNYLKGITTTTNINIQGTSIVTGKLFGGGYQSNIGTSSSNGSTTINVTGGTMQGDIHGGSEQGIVYGNTNINIGKDAVTDTSLIAGNINIVGNIYGAGSSTLAINRDSAETTTEYNYDYVSVVGNTFITMDNSTDSPISFNKTIYGAGNGATYNNGTVNDGSTIKIRDLGTSSNAHVMTSIERTGRLYISNSFVELLGKQDVNNQYKKTSYTLNRIIRTLTLAENSTLYTRRGFNMVGGINSYNSVTEYGTGTKTTVTITDGVATATADNRIYTFEGVNLIFAKEEGPLPTSTNFGDVNGMAFFGMYALDNSGNKVYDIYAPNYTSGAVEGYFGAGTYIEGKHETNHDISKDGFYTNVADFTGGTVTVTAQIIQPTPANATYYDWIIGAETITYDVSLIGSIFGDESMEELVLDFNYAPGATYTFDRVSLNALDLGVNLVDPTTITNISDNANNTFGLSIETGTTGWTSQASTNVYTTKDASDTTAQDNGAFVGDRTYKSDTSATPGSIRFKMHSSLNITEDKDLGYVNLILTGKTTTGEDPSIGNTFIIVIAVNLQTEAVPQIEDYVPRFTNTAETELHFTSDSRVDITYLLFKDMASNPYASGDYRVLSTTMPLPAGTKITLKDHGIGNSPKVYYSHITASTPYTEETVDEETRYIYRLSDFFEMDSTTAKYQDSSSYYHSEGYVLEKYDLSIDFIDAGIATNQLAQETYLELRDSAGANKYNNGDTEITYNLYATTVDAEGNTVDANAVMVETITTSDGGTQYSVIENTEVTFTLTASITEQKTADGKTIKDTKYYDKVSGIAIEVLNKSDERVKSPDAQNIKIVDLATSTEYVADESGIIRVPLLAGISSITKEYTFSITQQSVEPGRGSANIYFFASDDGKYYGEEPKLQQSFYLMFVNKVLGAIGIDATNDSRIINSSTGKNLSGNSGIDMTVNVGDAVEETNIRVELYKRNATYDENGNYTGTVYTAVDLNSYIQDDLDTPATHGYTAGTTYEYFLWEYEATETPEEPEGGEATPQTNTITAIEFEKLLESSVTTGEYKLVFKSYYENTLVQTVRKTFIVTE